VQEKYQLGNVTGCVCMNISSFTDGSEIKVLPCARTATVCLFGIRNSLKQHWNGQLLLTYGTEKELSQIKPDTKITKKIKHFLALPGFEPVALLLVLER